MVDTRHLNCLSPKGECGFDSRPDYKIKAESMEQFQNILFKTILPIIYKVIEVTLMAAMAYAIVMLFVNVIRETT